MLLFNTVINEEDVLIIIVGWWKIAIIFKINLERGRICWWDCSSKSLLWSRWEWIVLIVLALLFCWSVSFKINTVPCTVMMWCRPTYVSSLPCTYLIIVWSTVTVQYRVQYVHRVCAHGYHDTTRHDTTRTDDNIWQNLRKVPTNNTVVD